ncbi:E3 ubiquitin-protein ligase SspH2 [Abditibacteriota bacterium]|nr:E3 ubiquitin-protein ligase SspH2 [Abditibacteriota bacterium]
MQNTFKTPEQKAEDYINVAVQTGEQILDLSRLGLTTLPESIVQLSQLRKLDITGNQLTVLPEFISQLSLLEILDITDNQLIALPESIGQLAQLRELYISRNQLTVLPESIGQLTQLRELYIWDNRLTSPPESIVQLTQLRRLDISRNKLTTLAAEIGQLTQLQGLDVWDNRLTSLPESIFQLTQLKRFDISRNQLTVLPESIGQLTQLRELYIWGNQLSVLPESIFQLIQLEGLNISFNHLKNISESIIQLVQLRGLDISGNQLMPLPQAIFHLTRLERLNISRSQLTALPESIGQLTQLRELDIWDNRLTSLPESIVRLTQLQRLDISRNQLTVLPQSIVRLSQLQELDIWGNRLMTLPEAIGRLPHLKRLNISDNQLSDLPVSLGWIRQLKELYLHGNPAFKLPPEVIGSTWQEVVFNNARPTSPADILEYCFRSRQSHPINEAKLILVGRGGAGKTSLVKQLVEGKFDLHEKKTEGISITPWNLMLQNEKVRLNVWDFGGQEIMHATHQFFLTQRSLYLLVINAREGEQDANIEYWLRLIESFGAESPVIVIINKVKDHAFDLNRRGLQQKFPIIRAFVQTDCEEGTGLEELRAVIERETNSLEHLRDPFPTEWFQTKELLRKMKENFISYERYCKLCIDNGVKEGQSQDTLVGFLHNLGIVLNFKDDPRLSDTYVLNPEWVTNGIYKMLNAKRLEQSQGVLGLDDLSSILVAEEYPARLHGFLVNLMQKFELCFRFENYSQERYLIPELLDKQDLELKEFETGDCLLFQYHYNIVPEGLMPRFIVRTHQMSQGLPRWRTGVVLQYDGNRALVKADVQDRKVFIAVTGNPQGQRGFLTLIRSHFDHIHYSIARLQAVEMVPVPDYPKQVLEYRRLLVREANGRTDVEIEVGDDVIEISLQKLLNNIDSPTTRTQRRESERFKSEIQAGKQLRIQ